MARLLLIDANERHALRLATILAEGPHRVTVVTPESIRRNFDREDVTPRPQVFLAEADVVIVNMTDDRSADWSLLQDVCHFRLRSYRMPSVIAVSAAYHGPQPRLRAEKLGCRWVYHDEGRPRARRS